MGAMADFLNNFGQYILSFYNSIFFSFIKFLLGIYVVVVFVDIVLMLIQRGLGADIRDTLIGADFPSELTTRKGSLRKKWDKIRKKIESGEESKYKVAIIEADNIIDNLLLRMKYKGENMSERLEGINPRQIENIEDLKKAHEARNRIIHEENFHLTKEQAEEIIKYYEDFLRYFEVLG